MNRTNKSFQSRRTLANCIASSMTSSLIVLFLFVPPASGQQGDAKTDTDTDIKTEKTERPSRKQTQDQTDAAQQELDQEEILRWQKISPDNSGFQIQFPGEPKHVPRTVKPRPDLEVSVDMYTVSIRKGKVAFLAGFHDVQEMPTTDEKRKEILDGGIKGAMVNVVGELTSHESVQVDGNPARTFSYRGVRRGREIIGHSQLVLVGQRVYQITIIRLSSQELDQVLIDKFFTSFHLDEELRIESETDK